MPPFCAFSKNGTLIKTLALSDNYRSINPDLHSVQRTRMPQFSAFSKDGTLIKTLALSDNYRSINSDLLK